MSGKTRKLHMSEAADGAAKAVHTATFLSHVPTHALKNCRGHSHQFTLSINMQDAVALIWFACNVQLQLCNHHVHGHGSNTAQSNMALHTAAF
jgi:hypothetical protein